MIEFILVSLTIAILFIFLGIGMSFLLCPKNFEKYSVLFSPFVGVFYLGFAGWIVAHLDIGGVDRYGIYLLLPPIAFLALAITLKKGRLHEILWPFRIENLSIFLIGIGIYLFISFPFLVTFTSLTVTSLGNTDIAMYSTVAKFLQMSSLSGPPPAIDPKLIFYSYNPLGTFVQGLAIALPGSLLHYQSYQVVDIVLYLFFTFGLFISYIISSEFFGYTKPLTYSIMILTGLNFLLIFIVYHGFFSQILAMGLFLALFIFIFYPILKYRNLLHFFGYLPLAIIFLTGLMMLYPTLVPLFIIPLTIYLLINIFSKGNQIALKSTIVYLILIAFGTVLIYWASLMDLYRFLFDYSEIVVGWNFSPLMLYWVFGMLGNQINGIATTFLWQNNIPFFISVIISIPFLFLIGLSLRELFHSDRQVFYLSISFLSFLFFFYSYLLLKEWMSPGFSGDGYKAFKLVTYFLPLILISCFYYFKKIKFSISDLKNKKNTIGIIIILLLITFAFISAYTLIRVNNESCLIVDSNFTSLEKIQSMDNVDSINIREENWWRQMWIYYFLFPGKPLYLEYTTYYGSQPLMGEWDLVANEQTSLDIFHNSEELNETGIAPIRINGMYSLVSNKGIQIRIEPGDGWFAPENWSGMPARWMTSWSEILIYSIKDQTIYLNMDTISFNRPRTLEMYLGDQRISSVNVSATDYTRICVPVTLSEGTNEILLNVSEGCENPFSIPELNSSDVRCLSLAMENVTVAFF